MKLARLKWYAARLAAMSPAEVLHRLREARLKRACKADMRGWDVFAQVGDGHLADLPALRARLAAAATMPVDLSAIEALGQRYDVTGPGVWFRDPVSGADWPGAETYCFDIDVRSTGKDRGDVKFVWEINRLQFLHPLCAAVAAGRAGPQQLLDVLRSWSDANPPFRGVNWFSGIELAMRMVTLTLVVAAAGPQLEAEDRILLRRLIAAHGFWLHRYPSRYSSANNHLVAEGLGLLLAGMLAPDLEHAAVWEVEGRHILETEAALQILADGVGGEQSPTYQAFTMEMLAFGALIAEMLEGPLDGIVHGRLAAGATFLRALMDDAGATPRIGDDDQGYVLAQNPSFEPRYPASVVAAVAGLVNVPALLPPARDPHLRDALFAVPGGVGRTAPGVHDFPAGGYTIVRETLAGRNCVLTFDYGPLGYLSLAAHGHADALGVWLSLDDQPVFVDAGTYLYHSGGALRNALRSSAAHNTLTIRGQSQSIPSSAFSWSLKARAQRFEVDTGAEWHVSGWHDGYVRRFGVRHRRGINRTEQGFQILDLLENAAEPLPCDIAFLLAPDLKAETTEGGICVSKDGTPLLILAPPEGMTVRLLRGERASGRGLYSPAFGALEETTQIVLSGPVGAFTKITEIRIAPAASR